MGGKEAYVNNTVSKRHLCGNYPTLCNICMVVVARFSPKYDCRHLMDILSNYQHPLCRVEGVRYPLSKVSSSSLVNEKNGIKESYPLWVRP